MTRVAPVSCTGSASKKCMEGGFMRSFGNQVFEMLLELALFYLCLYEVILLGEVSLLWGNLGCVRESIDKYMHCLSQSI